MLYEKAGSPLANISDRLVVDAIKRASLTRRPTIIKYPPDYFNNSGEQSSSSSEDENNGVKNDPNIQKNEIKV